MKSNQFEELKKEIIENIGSSRGTQARMQYEILKLEEERKRNKYLFRISILLALIAFANLAIAIVKLIPPVL